MVDARLFLLVLIFTAFFVVATFLINRFFKGNKFIKYSPAALCLAAAIYNFFMASKATQGLDNIARILMGALFIIGLLSVVFSGLFIDLVMPKLYKKKK